MPGRRTKKPIPAGLPTEDPRDLYVKHGMSLEDVAKRLKGRKGCSAGQLRRRSAREKWPAQRDDWDSKVRQEADARSVVTAADQRAKQLARIRRVETTAEELLGKLEEKSKRKRGDRTLGEKQGVASALKEVTQTLALALEATSELVDDRDDRFTLLLTAAAEIAGPELTDVTDLTTDEELLEAMTTKGLDDLAVAVKPALEQQAEGVVVDGLRIDPDAVART